MKKAKLIDADKLTDVLQDIIQNMKSHGIHVTSAEALLDIVKSTPGVEAIPVEWLKKRQGRALDKAALYGKQQEFDIAKSIWNVMWIWEHERD